MLPACGPCNWFKKAKNVDGFRKKMRKALKSENCGRAVKKLQEIYGPRWNGKFYFEELREDELERRFESRDCLHDLPGKIEPE